MATALDLLKATIWSRRLLNYLDKSLIFGALLNRNWEGEVLLGQSVKISQVGPIATGTYVPNVDMPDPPVVTATQQTLTIDQFNYANFQVDNADRALININVFDPAMGRAAYALADKVDMWVAALLAAGAGTVLSHTAADAATTDPYDQMNEAAVRLDEASVPRGPSRWIVVPPWVEGLMNQDVRFTNLAASGLPTLQTGEIGQAAGFRIFKSVNCPATQMIGGNTDAASFANAMDQAEVYRMEKRFADAFKALHIYGAKVTQPTELLVVNLRRPGRLDTSLAAVPAAGGAAVTIKGAGFTGATGVTMIGAALGAFVVVDDGTITGTAGAHAAATGDIVVTRPQGNITKTGAVTYV